MFENDYVSVWNPVQSVVDETLNCECEVKNPQDLYAVGLWKMALQLAMYYVSSHASARYFLIMRHSGVFKPTLMVHSNNSNYSWS